MDVSKQILFLESQDTNVSQNAKTALLYLINLGSGISELVRYYAENRSERVLDLLCRIREPNDKPLLDTLQSTIRDKKMQETLILLGQIVQQNPSWVPKIPQHAIFKSILEYIKSKQAPITDVIAGLLFLSLLLPHCCAISNSTLNLMFNTFLSCSDTYIRLLEINRKTTLDLLNSQHLAFGIREYFQSLYGIYPAHFVHFVRNTFPKIDAKRRYAMESLIRTLINEVRLHPSLLFSSRESEAQRDRFSQKEPHDFLDEVRRVVIGVIPVPMSMNTVTDRSNSEPESPSDMHFSLSSYPYGDDSSSSSNPWHSVENSADLINGINTPEGSVSGTPVMKRNTISDIGPLVVTSEERRRRPSADVGRFRLGSIGSTIGNVIKRNITERRSVAVAPSVALIEIEQGNEAGHDEDDQNFEEAEEAVDDVPPMGSSNDHHLRRLYMSSPASSSAAEPETSPSSTQTSRPLTTNDIAIEKREESSRIREAAKKAKAAVEFKRLHPELDNTETVQQRETRELFDFIRSRSTSLMPQHKQNGGNDEPRGRTYTVDARFYRQENDGEASDSQDGGRSRFSVTSYFNKINRQRFVSECPPVVPDFQPLSPLTAKERSLERTMSCPVFVEESDSSAPRLKPTQLKPSVQSNINSLREQFPYLRLVEPLEPKFMAELENRLASEHDANRDSYMAASKVYHGKLKELGLADRLPGKIYDDMSSITDGLSLEKQRDILRARLQLVNQHLMYERSCRMLHANRNRRLYAKIKRQELNECELTNARQTNYNYDKEVASLRFGLTAKRKELIYLKGQHDKQLAEMGKHNKMLEDELSVKLTEVAELVSRTKTAERNYAHLKAQTDDLRRGADDAVAQFQLAHEKIERLEARSVELKRAHTENESLRDQIAFSDRAYEERLKSPENDDRLLRILQAELENLTKERDFERQQREEMRERNVELETVLREQQKETKNLQTLLDRSSRLLREQNEAAEQKFLSLQMVSQKQEEFISELFVELESAKDSDRDTIDPGLRSSVSVPRPGASYEAPPCGSTTSEPYFIRVSQSREPTPTSFSFDDKPMIEDY